MRKFVLIATALSSLFLVGAAKPGAPMVFRLHAETGPETREPFGFTATLVNPPMEVRVEKIPVITEKEVVAFYPFVSPSGGHGTYFQLDNHGTKAIEQITSSNRDRFLIAFINGRAISRLRIDRPVRDGVIVIPDGIQAEEIYAMGQGLRMIGESAEQVAKRRKAERERRKELRR